MIHKVYGLLTSGKSFSNFIREKVIHHPLWLNVLFEDFVEQSSGSILPLHNAFSPRTPEAISQGMEKFLLNFV